VIRIKRPARAPAILRGKGAEARERNTEAFARGETVFNFDSGIYGHQRVKRPLVKAQHGKCCFCESKVTHIASGHIEHFRPKGGVRQHPDEPLYRPGYFWLAYEWHNLLFSCELCNSRHKKNLFPLANPSDRARRPTDNLDAEQPMFIDPSREDPSAHIGFRAEYPFAINGSTRGEATWRGLGLDREALAEIRRDHLVMVKALKKLSEGAPDQADRLEATKLLKKFVSPRAQWSAMVRAAIGEQ